MKNKKAEQKILSGWWFFVLVIIGAGIVLGVLIYYGSEINVKELESDVLGERIIRCIVENGELREDFSNDFDVFKECKIKRELFEKPSDFYFRISFLGGDLEYEIKQGDFSLENDCLTEKLVEARHYARCSQKKEILVYNKDGLKKGELVVLAASNQEIKSISNV